MEISKTLDGNALMLSFSGALDAAAASALAAELNQVEEYIRDLVFDFEGVRYITPMCLCQLVLAQKKMAKSGGSLTLIRVPQSVMEVLRITGLAERLNILS